MPRIRTGGKAKGERGISSGEHDHVRGVGDGGMMYEHSVFGLGIISEFSKHASYCFTYMHFRFLSELGLGKGTTAFVGRRVGGGRRGSGVCESASRAEDDGSSLISH